MSRSRPYARVVPRGVVGVLIVIAVAVVLVWLAFYHASWLPYPQSQTQSQPARLTEPVAEQYELTEADNGKTFTYTTTSRFSVVLDGRRYPMPPACVPAGIVGAISNVPAVPPPYIAARFEAVVPGSCTLVAGAWQAVIMVTGSY